MRKLLSVLICVSMVLMLFIGCSTKSGSSPESGGATTKSPEESKTEGKTEEKKEVKPVNLSFIHWRSEDVEVFKKLNQQFETANPGVTIDMEVTSTNLDEYYTLVRTRMAGGQDMDVLCVHPGTRLQEIAAAGKLMDLTDQPVVQNYLDFIQESGKGHDGRIYGLAMGYNSHVIYYNKKMFREHNVEVPRTWEELEAVCNKFRSKNIEPIAAGFAENWVLGILTYPILAAYSPDNPFLQKDLEDGKVKLTDKVYKDTFLAVQEAGRKGFFQKDAGGTKYEPATTLFAQEKTPMLINGTWGIGAAKRQNENLELGFFPVPAPNGIVMNTLAAQALAIYSDTRNKDLSIKFIEHLSTKESAALYGTETIQIVGVKDVKIDVPELAEVMDIIAREKTIPFLGLYFTKNKNANTFYIACAKVFLGEDIDKTLQESQKMIEAEMAN